MKYKKKILIGLIFLLGGALVTIFSIAPVRSQIAEKVGITVAQTPTQWNNAKDVFVGDAQTNGLPAIGNYLFDPNLENWNRWRGTILYGAYTDIARTINLPVYTTISATLTTAQIAVGAGAGGTLIRAINLNRRSIIIRNQDTQADMYIGVNGVTIATGLLVKALESVTLDRTTAAIYGITAAANIVVGYLEE